ncbi:hypothetical protein CDIK_1060 [Cucumispora dikerogammari]|nr:hypothetical protein CDIK_1060 [Cucumispora dikerogammari]
MLLYSVIALKNIYSNVPLCDKVLTKGKKYIILTQQLTKNLPPDKKPKTLIVDFNSDNYSSNLIDVLEQPVESQGRTIYKNQLKLSIFGNELLKRTPELTHEPPFTEYFIGPFALKASAPLCFHRDSQAPVRLCKPRAILDRFFFIPFISKKYQNGNYFAICIEKACLKRAESHSEPGKYYISYETINSYKQLNNEIYLFQFFEKGNLFNKIKKINEPVPGGFEGCKDGEDDSIFDRIRLKKADTLKEPILNERQANNGDIHRETALNRNRRGLDVDLKTAPSASISNKHRTKVEKNMPSIPNPVVDSNVSIESKLESILENIENISNIFQNFNKNFDNKIQKDAEAIRKAKETINKLKILGSNDKTLLEKIDNITAILKKMVGSGPIDSEKLNDVICEIAKLRVDQSKISKNVNNSLEASLGMPKQFQKLTNTMNNINTNINNLVNNTNTINTDMRTYHTTLENISSKQEECNKLSGEKISKFIKNIKDKTICEPESSLKEPVCSDERIGHKKTLKPMCVAKYNQMEKNNISTVTKTVTESRETPGVQTISPVIKTVTLNPEFEENNISIVRKTISVLPDLSDFNIRSVTRNLNGLSSDIQKILTITKTVMLETAEPVFLNMLTVTKTINTNAEVSECNVSRVTKTINLNRSPAVKTVFTDDIREKYNRCDNTISKTVCVDGQNEKTSIPKIYLHTTLNTPNLAEWRNISKMNNRFSMES